MRITSFKVRRNDSSIATRRIAGRIGRGIKAIKTFLLNLIDWKGGDSLWT